MTPERPNWSVLQSMNESAGPVITEGGTVAYFSS
jgi:hypothetical protein